MPRKPKIVTPPHPPPVPEWDRNTKEPWHVEFDRERVNDDRWTCIVVAAVQTEDRDDECLLTYVQCVNTGLRRAVKIITMADVVNLLKEHVKPRKDSEPSKPGKAEKNKATVNNSVPSPPQIIQLAAKYATITDTECHLPPDLMAAVIKFLIFRLKEENCHQKKVEAARAKKLRERNVRAKFITEKKPFEKGHEGNHRFSQGSSSSAEKPLSDEPIDGPDLYIMLLDFYDVSCLQEMLKMNVPLRALVKISTTVLKKEVADGTITSIAEVVHSKNTQIANFWEKLRQEINSLETTSSFKDVAMMHYTAPPQTPDWKEYRKVIFDELTWTMYSVYVIDRQHQKYLQEMHVQRLILSLETLDLSRCSVYNKLCEALITGEPLTPLMVLFAIVEQVVAGVPETQSVALEYHAKHAAGNQTRRKTLRRRTLAKYSGGVLQSREKLERSPEKPRESAAPSMVEGSENSLESNLTSDTRKNTSAAPSEERPSTITDLQISEIVLDQVLSERKTEKELKAEKKWKTPFLCSHGDSIFIQSFYCDPRIFNSEVVVRRFLANLDFFLVWSKYPKLTPEEKVYYDFHFFSLWKISGLREDLLKIKIYFTLATKLMGITKSYLYRGAEENISFMSMTDQGRENQREKSMTAYNMILFDIFKKGADSFSKYFFKTFLAEIPHHQHGVRKAAFSMQDNDLPEPSFGSDSQVLMKLTSHLNVFHMSRCSIPFCHRNLELNKNLPYESKLAKKYHTLYSLLDCADITSLTDNHFLIDNEFHLNAIKSYKFYEKLEPNLMIQRALEAAENFNTIQYWHFLPTDTLIITMHDDFDHRGLFYNDGHGALPTPLALRDFHTYVYPEIRGWLIKENAEHSKFITELAEKKKAQEEKEDAQYLAQLTQEFEKMCPDKQKEFLETVEEPQLEIDEKDLINLPRKRRPNRSKKISFTGTNLVDLRVESDRKVNEFHSLDGTRVNVFLESWLYKQPSLLSLEVKREDLRLYYHHWIGQETNTSFAFKTLSGMIFSFYKNNEDDNDSKYYVTISWPTGLLIRPVWTDSTVYVKQFYLKPCRKGWRIEEEESRCFLKNGQLIVFKSNGDYDVLCASGTKYSFYDSATIPRYEIVSSTGEVWEMRTKGPCRNRKKLITRNKIFIGVDPKTHEAFYKREDGVQCMLWQSGRLVTNYPDGTKITSTPYFEEEEVHLEWTDEEKTYFEQLVYRYKSEQSVQEPRSRTILRNSSTSKTIEAKSFEFEGFTSISSTYLSEHPKYSTVHVNRTYPYLGVTLPENLNISIDEEGTYEIQKGKHFLKVQDTEVVFQTVCYDCSKTSTLRLHLDSSDTLCSFIDFFGKMFFTLRNGGITFHEPLKEELRHTKSESNWNVSCASRQINSLVTHHRCFALERDLSGVEFLHEDYVKYHISKYSNENPFNLQCRSDNKEEDKESQSFSNVAHTFSWQYSKAGYEKWVMDYEDPLDSLPVNIKKKDLKELGTKQVTKNLFQYPFPKTHNCAQQQPKERVKRNINAPKLIVSRTILCLSANPDFVINELQKHILEYQKQGTTIFRTYKERRAEVAHQQDSRYIEMRLKRIAITLNQSLHMYPHLCTQLPSTEQDIHHFGHLINRMQEMKFQPQDNMGLLPDCKQIPKFPKFLKFDSIHEENETSHS